MLARVLVLAGLLSAAGCLGVEAAAAQAVNATLDLSQLRIEVAQLRAAVDELGIQSRIDAQASELAREATESTRANLTRIDATLTQIDSRLALIDAQVSKIEVPRDVGRTRNIEQSTDEVKTRVTAQLWMLPQLLLGMAVVMVLLLGAVIYLALYVRASRADLGYPVP